MTFDVYFVWDVEKAVLEVENYADAMLYRQGKEVAVSVHSWQDVTIYASIAESLTFE